MEIRSRPLSILVSIYILALSILALVLIYLDRSPLDVKQKQAVEHSRLLIQRYIRFWFFIKWLVTNFSPLFVYRKIILMLYFIHWSNFIVWLSLLLEILCNMCIVITWYPVTSWILNLTLGFWSRRFLTWRQKTGQKLKYLKNKRSF